LKQNRKKYFGWASLALTAMGSWYLTRVDVTDDVASARGPSLALGYYINDAKLFGVDEKGQSLYQITARRLETSGQNNRLLLEDVRIEYWPRLEIPWLLTAASGEVPQNETYLELQGGVELAQQPEDGANGTIIQAEHLRLQPETFYAVTDEAVRIHLGQNQIDATGIRAYLKDSRLELESNVHGQFNP